MKCRLPPEFALLGMCDVLDYKMEVCGSYNIVKGCLVPKDCFKGYMEDGRYTCERNASNVTPITYHTHVYASPGYPSYEDLITLVTENKKIDIIFTVWGVWIIYITGPIDKKFIQQLLHRDISPFNNGVDRIKKLDARVERAIKIFISEMKKNNYNIKFYPWHAVENIKITY